jgi:hypothetical protein
VKKSFQREKVFMPFSSSSYVADAEKGIFLGR